MTEDPELKLTVLVENTARGRGILAEHGLSCCLRVDGKEILFDTGQGRVLMPNAQACQVDLRNLEAVVLSHGHYDHAGGLEKVLELSPEASVYLHPEALQERFVRNSHGEASPVNSEFLSGGGLEKRAASLVCTREPKEVLPRIWATGEVPRRTDYEDTGGDFFLDAAGTIPDPITDDQSLYFRSDHGIVLILGCAHAGVVNTMRYVAELTGEDRLHAVIGGMHLLHATPERLKKTYDVFASMKVDLIAPCHCTGIRAIAGFWNRFPAACVEVHAGKSFTFVLKP